MQDEVRRRELAEGETLEVFRLVHVSTLSDDRLVDDMMSNAAKDRSARGREVRQPEIHGGLSVYKSCGQAVSVRRRIVERLQRKGSAAQVAIGDYVARVVLCGPGYGYEDRNEPDGHMTIWGAPSRVAGAVAEIYPADIDP